MQRPADPGGSPPPPADPGGSSPAPADLGGETPHPAELRGRRVLILGLGAFGGGTGCARALARHGAILRATDLRTEAELPEAVASLDGQAIELRLGEHHEDDFRWADYVVVNPAIPERSPWLALARRHGCRLTTEINLAIASAHGLPALAITGTHGKSTAVSLAASLLAQRFEVVLGGNLGGSLLEQLQDRKADARLVIEVSSFQAARLEVGPGWPRVAGLTGLGRDHLDWHGDLEHYASAKRRLVAAQTTEQGFTLLPTGEPESRAWRAATAGRVLWLGPMQEIPSDADGWGLDQLGLVERWDGVEHRLAARSDLPFEEPYRAPSLLLAVGGARLLGLPRESVAAGLRQYEGLPHRMQAVPGRAGIRILDNGIATHPEPTVMALRHLEGPLVLIAGGKEKGVPLEELAEATRSCRSRHLFGEGGESLARLCEARGLTVRRHAGAEAAIRAALADVVAGETLLFSPSFASYDEFRNFRDRAIMFRNLCQEAPPPTE